MVYGWFYLKSFAPKPERHCDTPGVLMSLLHDFSMLQSSMPLPASPSPSLTSMLIGLGNPRLAPYISAMKKVKEFRESGMHIIIMLYHYNNIQLPILKRPLVLVEGNCCWRDRIRKSGCRVTGEIIFPTHLPILQLPRLYYNLSQNFAGKQVSERWRKSSGNSGICINVSTLGT